MTESYDGRQVVGMDLHRRRSVLVRMTADGKRLETARITNSAAELRREIAKAGEHPQVVLEATYGWYWAADELAAAGAEVHLAHPLGVKAFTYRRVKNDEKDAADLADLLRMGRLAEAWIAPPEVRELRELTRYRIKLVRMRSSGKEQVHAVLAKLGIPVTCSDLFGAWGSAWLDGLRLPQPYAGKVASLRELIGWQCRSVPLRTRRAEPWMAGGCDETAIASAEPCGVEPVRRLSRQVRRSAVHAEKADPQVDPYRRAPHRRRPDAPGPRRAGPLAAPAGRGGAHGGRHHMARRPGRAGSPARTVASLVCPAHPGRP
jgi:hypothetical protein